MSNVTKRDVLIDLSNQTGQTQAEVESIIDRFIDLVCMRLTEGKSVALRGFGTFEVRVAKAKLGRNPNLPGSEVHIPARCVIRFKPGSQLRDQVAMLPVADGASDGLTP